VVEFRQLEYFIAVAEEGTFTKGARRVRVAQSAVSATIRKLERELGTPLFVREPQSTSLTEAGMALLPEARALLRAEDRARETVDQVCGGLRGTIRIGAQWSIGTRPAGYDPLVVDLPAMLGRFHVTHPLVTFQLRPGHSGTASLLADVAAGTLDLAMVAAVDGTPGVRLWQLGTLRWRFVCSLRHRLADADSVTLHDLRHEKFVDFPLGWGIRSMLDRAFAAAGIVRDSLYEATDQAMAVALVRNGLGVTFLPWFGYAEPGTSFIEAADTDLDMPMALAAPADRKPTAATSALIDSIVKTARHAARPRT
jgi:DNA-binding transcriptional LysR family regulator